MKLPVGSFIPKTFVNAAGFQQVRVNVDHLDIAHLSKKHLAHRLWREGLWAVLRSEAKEATPFPFTFAYEYVHLATAMKFFEYVHHLRRVSRMHTKQISKTKTRNLKGNCGQVSMLHMLCQRGTLQYKILPLQTGRRVGLVWQQSMPLISFKQSGCHV